MADDVRHIFVFILLGIAAMVDIRKRIIPDWIPVLLVFVSFILPGGPRPAGILTGLPLFVAGVTSGGMGGGDVKLVSACGLAMGLYNTATGLLLGLALLLGYHVWSVAIGRWKGTTREQGRSYPLAPFFLSGMFLSVGFV